MKKLTLILLTVIILLGGSAAVVFNKEMQYTIPSPKTYDEIKSSGIANFFDQKEAADVVYVVYDSKLSKYERASLICLQGLTAQERPGIYLHRNNLNDEYIKYYEEQKIVIFSEKNEKDDAYTFWDIVKLTESQIKDKGYIVYNDTKKGDGQLDCFYNLIHHQVSLNREKIYIR